VGTDVTIDDGPTILVAEDDEGVRSLVHEFLSSLGYRLLVAGDGTSALRLASSHSGRIDLLLTDVVMPGMDGFELAARLRAERPGLPVLAMSGYTRRSGPVYDTGGEVIPVLPKPFGLLELQARIRDLLGRAA
jgi:DNA-binding response OmpR family regulator